MGPLATLFSTIDSAKRKVGGLLEDPSGTLEQMMGQLQDYRRQDQRLGDQAFGDPRKNEPLVKDKAAFAQLGQRAFDNLMGFAPAGITVWHGSPHKFSQFDSSKIGTGEGSQAYGHGIYVAESPVVARQYQEALAGGGLVDGAGAKISAKVGPESNALSVLKRHNYDFDAAIKELKKPLSGSADGWGAFASGAEKHRASELEFLQNLKASGAKFDSPGNLYKVDLPDDAIAKMLDWDKPLSQQAPEVRMLARDLGISGQEVGAKFYQALTNQARDGAIARGQNSATTLGASQAAASDDLRAMGIPGIRYLDGGSRGAGGGTSNFVIFPGNEGLLSILERNGQPLR